MPRIAPLWFLCLVGLLGGGHALAQTEPPCGAETPCEIENGGYHLLFPPEWDGETPLPAVIYFHGHRSSGASVFRGGSMQTVFADAGYLVIAPNGQPLANSRGYRWPARPPEGQARDDVAFTLDVLADASRQVPQIDNDKIYVTGFSAGGSMAWMMACYAGQEFAGFTSVAGALRRPAPQEVCPAGPIRVLQIHGFSDTQVPLEGRGIGDWHQGDVFETLSLARRTNSCRSNPDEISIGTPFSCRTWGESCGSEALALCLHDGGHGLPKGWAEQARDWFEGGLAQ